VNLFLDSSVPSVIPDSGEITDLSVIVGKPTTLFCPAEGIPLPQVTWFKDGDLLDPRESSNIRYAGFKYTDMPSLAIILYVC